MKRTLVFGMAAWTLAACASAGQDMQQADRDAMPAAEAQEFLADTTQYGRSRDGNSYVVYRAPDGEIRGRAWGSWGESFDTGPWSVDENGVYCAEYHTSWGTYRRPDPMRLLIRDFLAGTPRIDGPAALTNLTWLLRIQSHATC